MFVLPGKKIINLPGKKSQISWKDRFYFPDDLDYKTVQVKSRLDVT
jgi:hypothetical protein